MFDVSLTVFLVIIVIIIAIYYYRGRETYRNYFGSGVPPLVYACASPYCGGDPGTYSEDTEYPFLLLNKSKDSSGFSTDAEQLKSIVEGARTNTKEVNHIVGRDLLNNYTTIPNNDVDIDIKQMISDINKAPVDTSLGMQRAEQGEYFSTQRYDMGPYDGQIQGIDTRDAYTTGDDSYTRDYPEGFSEGFAENFMQAPSARTYTPMGDVINDHPGIDGFNRMYYANAGRTVGIADDQQAVTHFNESTAYYGNVQKTLPASADAARWNARNEPQMNASEYFNILGKYSDVIDDPRQPVIGCDYSTNGPVYKKRMYFVDLVDEMNRKRNGVLTDAAERGTRVTNTSRGIMDTVFGSDMDKDAKLPWWETYES